MKKITPVIMVLFLLFGASFSYALTEEEIKGLEGTALPDRLGVLFGNVNINVHVLLPEGKETVYGLVTKDKKVHSVAPGGVEKPALNVYVDEATVQAIESTKNPLPIMLKALKEKKISYKAIGFVNKVKFAFLSVYSNAAGLFKSDLKVDEGKKSTAEQEEKQPEKSPIEPEEKDKEDREEEEEPQKSPIKPREQNESEEKKDEAGLLTGGAVGELKDGETHFVELTDSGFEPDMLTIKVGDTVVWQNVRTGNINKVLVIGVRECAKMRSKLFSPGESFSWTFDGPMECTVVDGIVTTIASTVVVE